MKYKKRTKGNISTLVIDFSSVYSINQMLTFGQMITVYPAAGANGKVRGLPELLEFISLVSGYQRNRMEDLNADRKTREYIYACICYTIYPGHGRGWGRWNQS